jgi:hypothetical protein
MNHVVHFHVLWIYNGHRLLNFNRYFGRPSMKPLVPGRRRAQAAMAGVIAL